MRSSLTRLVRMGLVIGLCATLWGCAARDRKPGPGVDEQPSASAGDMKPIPAEMPNLTRTERILPIVVGVEGQGDTPRVTLVRPYEKIEFTPEERKALGLKEPVEPDVLLFYRPPAHPDRGLVAVDTYSIYGVGGVGGATYGVTSFNKRIAVDVTKSGRLIPHCLARRGVSVSEVRRPMGAMGEKRSAGIGENLPREGAARKDSVEH
ncbi:hypothetical protein [uncultured Ilyobacter sp.]|uniref:hypothetical protein n=1 Tax=uncultured Ilyobacter sp. TaxID=544433 RepID=UPI0029F5A59D|nr:hypothetical protein [uncultured Ilyobacter sp.]